MKTLETKRLILRDWEITDLDDAFLFWSNPNVTVPEGSTPRKSKEECLPILKYLINAKNNYALVLKETGRVLGSVGINEDAVGNENARNLGFLLAEFYWNQGLMSEALEKIISVANEITPMLSATHNISNVKSEHILKKFGFKYVKTIKNIQRKVDVAPHDEPYYILEIR